MRFSRHTFTVVCFLILSVSLFVSAKSQAPCEVALSMIDNETGEAVENSEVLLFPGFAPPTLRGKTEAGKIVLSELEDGNWGVMTVSEGFKNSFFWFNLNCDSLGESGRKQVFVPLWKGDDSRTMVMEFSKDGDHLALKDLGLARKETSDSPDAPTSISKGFVNGSAKKLFRPEYPEAARSMRVKGEVHVLIVIGFDGKVESAELVKGNKIFRDAVEDAAKRSEFAPTFLMGVPVKATGVIMYNF